MTRTKLQLQREINRAMRQRLNRAATGNKQAQRELESLGLVRNLVERLL